MIVSIKMIYQIVMHLP